MQKYIYHESDPAYDVWVDPSVPDGTEFYLASDVDAYRAETGATIHALQAGIEQRDARIAELENALRDVRGEIEAYSGLRAEYQDWTDALKVIDSALMEGVTK